MTSYVLKTTTVDRAKSHKPRLKNYVDGATACNQLAYCACRVRKVYRLKAESL